MMWPFGKRGEAAASGARDTPQLAATGGGEKPPPGLEGWLSRYAVEKVLVDDIGDTSGLKSVVAIDLSSRRDLTAVAVVWLGDPLLARVTAWTPEANILPWTAEYKTPWDEWAVAGHVRAVPSPAVDYDLVVREMRSVFDDPGCRMIVFDPWKKPEFLQAMDRAGVAWAPGEKVLPRRILAGMGPPHIVEHKQGYMRGKGDHEVRLWMHNSIDETSIAVLEGRIRIETNPVLAHGVASVAIARDASGNQRFIKNKTISGGRDDCAVALAMAVGAARALTGDARPQLSFEEMLGMRSA